MTEFCILLGLFMILGFFLLIIFVADRHSHNWRVKGTHYTAPNPQQQFKVEGTPEVCIGYERRHNEGITHVYLQCDSCGEVSEREVYGHFSPGAKLKDDELAQLRKMVNLE